MIGQIVTLKIFFTLSAADYHYPGLFGLLEPNIGATKLTDAERKQLMDDNPLLTDLLFQKRDIVFEKNLDGVGFVDNYWVCFECRWCESPHIHSSPNLKTLDMTMPKM